MRSCLLLLLVAVFAVPAEAGARTLTWSGLEWEVRAPGFGTPGPNHWSDSEQHVRVEGSQLVLAIDRDAVGHWAGAELQGRRSFGYGTYRWIVDSDLSRLDPHDVLGLFTYGGPAPSFNELDIEPARWGHAGAPSGAATIWRDAAAGSRSSQPFHYSARPPYVNEITWTPGRVRFFVADAAGTVLLDWTAHEAPVPAGEVPMINLWRFGQVAPAAPRVIRLASFSWSPADATPPPPPPSVAVPPCGRVSARPARSGAVVRWHEHPALRVRLVVERRGRTRYVRVRQRLLRAERGRVGLATGLRPGRYRLAVTLESDRGAPCATARLRFRVPRR